MKSICAIAREGSIGILEIDAPPVNALGIHVRRELAEGLRLLDDDPSVDAILILCGGRTFFAGADISEFGRPAESPTFSELFDLIEFAGKPVIAAIHGTSLGGGLELALVCHYRIAALSAKLGFPEVRLGLLPGAGGTQRLPRLIGVEAALDMMIKGAPIPAQRAHDLGILDAIAEDGNLRRDAIAFAGRIVREGAKPPLVRELDASRIEISPGFFDDYRRKHAQSFRGFKAPEAIVQAVEAAVTLPFDDGVALEHALFERLLDTRESAAQRHYFFAERASSKVPNLPSNTPVLPIRSIGVIGAGTMGGGIAMNFLNIGLPVTLVETGRDALDRGLGKIRGQYEGDARKGKIAIEEAERRMALITPVIGLDALSGVDLVIEAAFEEMGLKKAIFEKLGHIVGRDTLLASNTSFLNIDEIASATHIPERVLGLHFFSPANVMRLLEIVRGRMTSNQALATALDLAKTIGKIPVVSGVCHGFIANRVMEPYIHQALALLLEGLTPQEIDSALVAYGFAMGPLAMLDLIGLDVLGRESKDRTLMTELVELGRLGQKQGGGFYDYDTKRRPQASPQANAVIARHALDRGFAKRNYTTDDIIARLLYPVVNEGARILDEGVATRASDIDVACILGYNWPVYTGGPMFWANEIGLTHIVEQLEVLKAIHGPSFEPAMSIKEAAARGRQFT